MSKYAVDERPGRADVEKRASAACPECPECPKCGRKPQAFGAALLCPVHGSEPFERTGSAG